MALTAEQISKLLQPYVAASFGLTVSESTTPGLKLSEGPTREAFVAPAADWPSIYEQLAVYLDLLLKWNARMNLTAIRSPEEIVRRHFGESLFAARYLQCSTWNIGASNPGGKASAPHSLLDFGSGAGFPGLPIQIFRPQLAVTLAEARQKKASFLREVIRSLRLATEVWADRVESLPKTRQFDVVTMRAVDDMQDAIPAAAARATRSLLILGNRPESSPESRKSPNTGLTSLSGTFSAPEFIPIPESTDGVLLHFRRISA